MTLAVLMVALVEATDEDDDISFTGLFYCLSSEFGLSAGLIERTAYSNAVVALDGIANVASRVLQARDAGLECIKR